MNNQKGQVSGFVIAVGIVAILIGLLIGWSFNSPKTIAPLTNSITRTQGAVNTAQDNLRKDMRKLWEDHITWTRMYLVSAVYNNSDTDKVADRLLKNQEDIGNAIKSYYGEVAGSKLTQLLKTHITTAVEILSAAKVNNQPALKSANDRWYQNANEISDFLSGANPNFSKDELRMEMQKHLDLTKQEALDILGNKFEAGIADYDEIHNQILKMADMLTNGIVKQFPDKF